MSVVDQIGVRFFRARRWQSWTRSPHGGCRGSGSGSRRRQGIFRDVDAEEFAEFACHFTAVTDGAAIQVLTGAQGMTIDVMRHLLSGIVDRELSLTPTAAQL